MNQNHSSLNEVTEELLKLEEEFNVFDIEPYGVPIWERIRFNLWRNTMQFKNSTQENAHTEDNSKDYLKGILLWAKNAINKNPFLSGEHNILFYGHPRRKLGVDNKWWDIYCDPITDGSDLDYLHVERPYLMSHKSPAKTENLRYIDFIWYLGAIRRNIGISNVEITGEEKERLQEVSQAVSQRFGMDVNLLNQAEIKLTKRDSLLDLYKRFLKGVNPEIVMIIVSYGKETFIEACHDLDITTVELQHGVIHPDHLGYSFPEFRNKKTFPNYLFSWGEFWNTSADYPISDDRVLTMGFPYLEQKADQYEPVESNNQLLFISQERLGEQISRFAIEIDQHPEIDADIVYKVHPGEVDYWKKEYPWLVDADFDVVDDSTQDLYQLFSESTAQVGVHSTAIYEGLYFGLETYLYDCPGERTLKPLLNDQTATLVSSATQLASTYGRESAQFDREYYFTENATDRIHNKICDLSS